MHNMALKKKMYKPMFEYYLQNSKQDPWALNVSMIQDQKAKLAFKKIPLSTKSIDDYIKAVLFIKNVY